MHSIIVRFAQISISTVALLFTAAAANAQTYVIEFLNESSVAPTTPITAFELPPPWSADSVAVGTSVGVGND